VYCNGISTSLPADVQDQLVRMMPGCERARILRYGYAVEYDMVRPHQIHATGMTRLVDGLFLAGQINGTSGYEEAAAQGLVAGVNAVRLIRGQGEWVPGRDEAYIGVMMDDLVTRSPTEPYRMFTSRAEHRLLLRADNAPDRLTPAAIELGLLDATDLGRLRRDLFAHRQRQMDRVRRLIESARVDGLPLKNLIRRPEFAIEEAMAAVGRDGFGPGVWKTVWSELRYEAYIARQRIEIRRQGEFEHRRIPADMPWESLTGFRAEARAALERYRPDTFGQASRLEGVTPADLTLLAVLVKRRGGFTTETQRTQRED
jgi:tRNA uridine 5-carboxymethylaminomethyl modification enzyme